MYRDLRSIRGRGWGGGAGKGLDRIARRMLAGGGTTDWMTVILHSLCDEVDYIVHLSIRSSLEL